MAGLKPNEFLHEFTPSETYFFLRGVGRIYDFHRNLHQVGWQVARWHGAISYNSNCKKGQGKSPEQLLKLPAEKKEVRKISKSDTKELLRKSDKVMKKIIHG